MGDALKEAGFQPNQLTAARTREDLLTNLAALVRELGHFPVEGEIRLEQWSDRTFPSHSTFGKFGGMRALAAQLEKFAGTEAKTISRNSVLWRPRPMMPRTRRKPPRRPPL
jgi:hypothetical protein